MIKKIILISCLFLSAAFVVQADFSVQDWQYKKSLLGTSSGLAEVFLDNEVFAGAAKNLADIRVVDSSKQEVPYKLITVKNEEGRKNYSPKMINKSVVVGKYSSVILDLGQRGIITNSLTIQTSSENFQRNVTVFGSDNQTGWNILKANAYVYDYTDKRGGMKSQDTSVSFPDSVFQFLKIEISDSDNNPVAINSVSVNQYAQKNAEQFSIASELEAVQDTSKKTTTLIADMGQSGIPANKISLLSSGENFNRGANVYSANDKNSSDWQYIGQGYIFRYNTPKFVGENTALDINETTNRYIKIIVYNNDNAPLNFSGAKIFATQRELIFQAQADKKYELYYGNAKAVSPKYDLDQYLKYFDLSSAQKISLGPQTSNSDFVLPQEPEKPFTERMPYFLPVGLTTLGLILLLLVYKFLKK